MRVLITGGAGYIGSVITRKLLSHGYTVTVYDDLIYGGEALVPFFYDRNFKFIAGDILDVDELRLAMRGQDMVVHLAAIVGEKACAIDPKESWRINRDGAIKAHQLALSENIKTFVFASTCSNYGVSDSSILADEAAPLQPQSDYAKAKVEAENYMLDDAGRMRTIILRFGTIFGLSGRMRFDLIVSELAVAIVNNRVFEIYKPEAWRPFLHVRDAARAIYYALQKPKTDRKFPRVYNVVGENLRKTDLSNIAKRYYPEARIVVTDGNPDRRDYRVNGDLFQKEYWFKSFMTVAPALVQTVNAIQIGVFPDVLTIEAEVIKHVSKRV